MDTGMDLQKLAFFTEGNTFTGSRTKNAENGLLLRYRVKPDPEEHQLVAHCWKQDVCFELAEPDAVTARFPLDEEGLNALANWLLALYQAL